MSDLQNSDMRHIRWMVSALALASARLNKLWILFLNTVLDRDSRKNSIYFHIFSFFLVFNRDFVIYIDFTRIAASNTATDDVTNQVTHRIFNTNL